MKERIKAAGEEAQELVPAEHLKKGRQASRENDMCEAYTGTMQAERQIPDA